MDIIEKLQEIEYLKTKAQALLENQQKEKNDFFCKLNEFYSQICRTLENLPSNIETEPQYKGDPIEEIPEIYKIIQTITESTAYGYYNKEQELCVELYHRLTARLEYQKKDIEKKILGKCKSDIERLIVQAYEILNSIPKIEKNSHDYTLQIPADVTFPKTFPDFVFLPLGKYLNAEQSNTANTTTTLDQIFDRAYNETDLSLALEEIFNDIIRKASARNRANDFFGLSISDRDEKENLIVFCKQFEDNEAIGDVALLTLLKTIIYRFIVAFPRATKKICYVQSRRVSRMQGFLANFYSDEFKSLVGMFSENGRATVTSQKPGPVIDSLLEETNRSNILLEAFNGEKSLFSYNRENYDKGVCIPQTLLIIKDFPNGFDIESIDKLEALLQQANTVGLTVVLTVCQDMLEALCNKNEKMKEKCNRIFSFFRKSLNYKNEDFSETLGKEKIEINLSAFDRNIFDFELFKSKLIEHMRSVDNDPYIPLKELIQGFEKREYDPNDKRRKNFPRVLSCPIGRKGTEIFSLDLHSDSAEAHTVISGMTGTGKSVLLHDIILSTIFNYSPEEVQLYLFDFKQTPGGFRRYENMAIPHIKIIGENSDPKEINLLLRKIQSIYINQMNAVQTEGCYNIIDYNEKAMRENLNKIPRLLIIIDEYHTIQNDESIAILDDIARKGREYGVNLIMASQKGTEGSISRILNQFIHRIEFKNEPVGNLINQAARISNNLDGPRGLFFYAKGERGTPILVRSAFDGGKKYATVYSEQISYLCSKWEPKTYLVGHIKPIKNKIGYNEEKKSFEPLIDIDHQSIAMQEAVQNEPILIEKCRQKFRQTEDDSCGYALWLGINNITLEPVICTLEKNSPHTILFGGRNKCKNIIFSVIKNAFIAGEGLNIDQKQIFFFDNLRDLSSDDPVAKLRSSKPPRINFYIRDNVSDGITALYSLYKARLDGDPKENYPVLGIFNGFLDYYKKILNTANLQEVPDNMAPEQLRKSKHQYKEVNKEMIKEILTNGPNYNLFFVFLFDNFSMDHSMLMNLINPGSLYVFPAEEKENETVRQAMQLQETLCKHSYNQKNKYCAKYGYRLDDPEHYCSFVSFEYVNDENEISD